MPEFLPKNAKTSVDFIAWPVAQMEHDKTPTSPYAVAENIYLALTEPIYNRLNYYRLMMKEKSQ